MKIPKILPYICIAVSLFLTNNKAFAENTIARIAEYAPEMPDTFIVQTKELSNSSQKQTLNITFEIRAKGTDFDIYSTELHVHDSIIMPIVPLSMSVSASETADSLVTWNCDIEFPYRAIFYNDDVWVLNTSHGQVCYNLIPESIRNYNVMKLSEQRSNMNKRAVAGILLAGVLTLCFIDIYRRGKRKSIKDKLFIEEQFAIKDFANAELKKKVDTLYADRWRAFNHLCNEYFNKKDAYAESVRLSVFKELEKQIAAMRSHQSLIELEQLVNIYDDNILQQIRVQIPSLTKKDTAFLTYLFSGFSPRAICLFTDIKIKNFYNRKARLKDKILASGAPDSEKFASKL